MKTPYSVTNVLLGKAEHTLHGWSLWTWLSWLPETQPYSRKHPPIHTPTTNWSPNPGVALVCTVQAEAAPYRPEIPTEGGFLPAGYSLPTSSGNNMWSAWHSTAGGRKQRGFLHGPPSTWCHILLIKSAMWSRKWEDDSEVQSSPRTSE